MISLYGVWIDEVEIFIVDEKLSEHDLLSLFLAFYQRIDGELSAKAVWALITFIRNFGVESTSLPLAELAKVTGIQIKRLRDVLNELEQQGILKIDFPETGKRARVRHLRLNLDYIGLDLIMPVSWRINSTKSMHKKFPLLKFISILFLKSDGISISNLPK